jgi:glutamine synthetase type III
MGISGLGIGSLALYRYHDYISKKFIYSILTGNNYFINISAPNISISIIRPTIAMNVIDNFELSELAQQVEDKLKKVLELV